MADTPLDRLVRRYRVVARLPALDRQSDADLLRLFARDRDEAAFELLVRRHGPTVWGVCCRLLTRPDAEDAFQATFLLLVRKAGSLAAPEAVGSWLFGAARRTALEARAMAARRRTIEAKVPPRPVAEPPDYETLAALDAELAALPERYRAAIVLCDLTGKTRSEAALELGCAEGTVASRLARGRALLAGRLATRGVTLSAAGLAGLATPAPAALVHSTTQLVALFAAGDGLRTLAPSVHTLFREVSRPMIPMYAKQALVLLTAATLAIGGATLSGAAPRRSDSPPAKPVTAKPAIKPETPAERFKKLKAEYDADIQANTKLEPGGGRSVTQPRVEKYAADLLDLGRSPDDKTAVTALSLAVRGWVQLPVAHDAFDLLLERYADSPLLADFARNHHSVSYPGKFRRLQRLLGVATDPKARAISLLDLALEMEPGRASTQLGEGSDDRRIATAVALYRRVIAEYPDVIGGPCDFDGCHLGNIAALPKEWLDRLESIQRPGEPQTPTKK